MTAPPCYRCDERPASRYGRAQVLTPGGVRWLEVVLCDRCAAQTAAPPTLRSGLGAEHTITSRR